MKKQNNAQSNTGCLLNAVIIMLLIVIAFGVFGGAAVLDASTRQAPNFPNIPAPAPAQLNYVPSVQTFAEPAPVFDPCADPAAPVPGWEKGIGGELPPCWGSWTREQQNAFLRSH